MSLFDKLSKEIDAKNNVSMIYDENNKKIKESKSLHECDTNMQRIAHPKNNLERK
ncbi:MAG: hypothetical protein V4544_00775 [Pseudomonadota bacterium]